MLPTYDEEILVADFTEGEIGPSRTYRIEGDHIAGYVDEDEALRQAVELILRTERFSYGIYTWNYGVELEGLFGLSPPLLYARLGSRIEEALLADDRITAVEDFTYALSREGVVVGFTVKTVFGELRLENTVSIEERLKE